MLAAIISCYRLILYLGIMATNIFFLHLLKAPTLAGRQLLDEIEGSLAGAVSASSSSPGSSSESRGGGRW